MKKLISIVLLSLMLFAVCTVRSYAATTYTVVKGDSLWSIAQKYYGNGSKYPQIKEKNKYKYPSLSKNNIIYVGWVLEI